MATFLFVHQNFPGQFPHLTQALAAAGHRVIGLGDAERLKSRQQALPGIELLGYASPKAEGAATHHYLRDTEAHVRRGQAVARAVMALRQRGVRPDLVVAHPGWGEALYLKDVLPDAKHLHYLEFFYRGRGTDVGFDPQFPAKFDDVCRVRTRTATQLIGMEYMDAGLSPTAWQKQTYPARFWPDIHQIHDGIDTGRVRPQADAQLTVTLPYETGQPRVSLNAADPVLTYVARNLEPYRGFHVFMRAIPQLLRLHPRVRIAIVGGDAVSYGRKTAPGTCYRELLQAEWPRDLDRSRVLFCGRLPYGDYLRLLQLSSLHVYLTYPFVLSWSLLEAMASGCLVLGSDTGPLREVLRDGENGFLTDFHDHEQLARRAAELLQQREQYDAVRARARETVVQHYDLRTVCLPRQVDLLQGLL